MTGYVALLRAVNVGGRGIVKKDALPRLPLRQPTEALDLVHVSKRDCWVVSRRKPSGMYGFPSLFVEAALGVTSTARSWSTVVKLAALLASGGGRP